MAIIGTCPEPRVLAEIPAPDWALPEHLCRVVHGKSRLIWGEGNPQARLGIILDNPGQREGKDGEPFLCPTRRALQRALWHAGVALDDIQVWFLFKCRPGGAYDRQEAYRTFLPILSEQIRGGTVQGLIGLGNTVAQGLLGPEASVKALRGRVLHWEGLPLCLGYHPLAVHRRPNLEASLIQDLRRAAFSAGLAVPGGKD